MWAFFMFRLENPSMPSKSRWIVALLISAVIVWLHIGSITHMDEKGSPTLASLAQVHAIIANRYIEKIPEDEIGYNAIRGMVSSLDRHSRFFDPKEAAAFRVDTSGHFGGLGIYITLEKGLVSIIAPIEGSPAALAGLLPGDLLLKLDDKEYHFQSTSEASKVLKGEEGSPIKLLVLHKGTKKPFEVIVKRSIIKIESVRDVRILDKEHNIGYLRLNAFQEESALQVDKAMMTLVKKGAKAVILDLRANPGGLLRTATRIADMFLEKGKLILTTRSRSSGDDLIYSQKEPPFGDMLVAVLLDEGSASASEILGGALRDHGRAFLAGARSYGKGSVQSVIDTLDGESILKITTAYYYTPSGRRIHRPKNSKESDDWGLHPDIKVLLTLDEKRELLKYQNQRYVMSLEKRAGKKPTDKVEFKDRVVDASLKQLRLVLTKKVPLIPTTAKSPTDDKAPEKSAALPKDKAPVKEKQ
jgi:carboxyl-terminal processing protease